MTLTRARKSRSQFRFARPLGALRVGPEESCPCPCPCPLVLCLIRSSVRLPFVSSLDPPRCTVVFGMVMPLIGDDGPLVRQREDASHVARRRLESGVIWSPRRVAAYRAEPLSHISTPSTFLMAVRVAQGGRVTGLPALPGHLQGIGRLTVSTLSGRTIRRGLSIVALWLPLEERSGAFAPRPATSGTSPP